MTIRKSGSYTHEQLIALEDSHFAMLKWIGTELSWLKHIREKLNPTIDIDDGFDDEGFDEANKTGSDLIGSAISIRLEVGL